MKMTSDAASRSLAASIGGGDAGGRQDRKEERKRKAHTAPKSAAGGSSGSNSREVKVQKVQHMFAVYILFSLMCECLITADFA